MQEGAAVWWEMSRTNSQPAARDLDTEYVEELWQDKQSMRLWAPAPAMVNEVSGNVVFLVAARACLHPSYRQRDGFDWIIFWVETQKIQGRSGA